MVNYECEICKKQFGNYKSHYITHKNKKNPYEPLKINQNICIIITYQPHIIHHLNLNNELIEIETKKEKLNNLQCDNCDKIFSRKDNLTRHQNTICKQNKKNNDNEQITKLIELNEHLIKQNDENNKKFEEIKKQNDE